MTDRLALAFQVVDHAYFCLDKRRNPFPQTSAPDVIARMLRALDAHAGSHVLEIGTGSGYSTALLGEVIGPGGLVASIDVDPPVLARARSLLLGKGYTTVHMTTGDGRLGWPAFAPYDRIIAWCSIDALPQTWLDQTSPEAILVVPMRSAEHHWIGSSWQSRMSNCGRVPSRNKIFTIAPGRRRPRGEAGRHSRVSR
jgi:protein-L-isoaspartate(D-aspartate) O-methyltransferase